MNENYLLKTQNARQLYFEAAANLPIIDFHNHISVSDLAYNKSYDNVYELWLKPDPYKHRLMRICGIPEFYITGDAEPYEKFLKFCSIFPMLAGNPVYDWSRMELLKVFDLDSEADTLAANLPYGKQRKLEIARALATKPKLLLLDEPAAGMNPNETLELMDTIRFVRDNFDMTILLIEHDMKLVSGICEELTVLNFGRVLCQGKTSDVLNNPEVIKAYLGE